MSTLVRDAVEELRSRNRLRSALRPVGLRIDTPHNLTDDHAGKVLQHRFLIVKQLVRNAVDDAQGPEPASIWGLERRSRANADTRRSHYQGIVTKPRIEPGVPNLENIVPQDCMAAKSDFPARLVTVETRGGPEPLPQNTPEAVKSW